MSLHCDSLLRQHGWLSAARLLKDELSDDQRLVEWPPGYLFIFIGFSQQMRQAVSAQPQAVSTVTLRPQTPQVYLLPFFMPADVFAVFFAAVFTVAFLTAVFPDFFGVAISFPFLFNVLPP